MRARFLCRLIISVPQPAPAAGVLGGLGVRDTKPRIARFANRKSQHGIVLGMQLQWHREPLRALSGGLV